MKISIKVLSILLILLIINGCVKNSIEPPKEEQETLSDRLIIGDSSITQQFTAPFKLTSDKYIIKDSLATDTIQIDLDDNGKNEFTFIYVGEHIDYSNQGQPALIKTRETIYVNYGDGLMRLEKGLWTYDYGWAVSFPVSYLNDTLSWQENWIWPSDFTSNHILYDRTKNSFVGFHNEEKAYLAYKRQDNRWGWISIQINLIDQFYFKELIIEEYADKLRE